ncbi:MAG: hypothetical protein C5B47_08095 [Verrucomicrobia bacterium]|nr:MAG: hypothetical protein C5B47_08095 [Verrucomicrobiota bacterium]
MEEKKNLAQMMRDRLNKRAGRKVTLETTKTEELVQVEGWIEMPEYFRRATGAPGIPIGHITQVIGKSDTGKTTLIMEVMVRVQKTGGVVFLIDSEHKFSFERFRIMGGIAEDIVILPVESLEAAWNAWNLVCEDVEDLRKSNPDLPILAVWDSAAASIPDAILEAEAEDQHVSVEARVNNKEIRKLRQKARKYKIAMLIINHSYFSLPKFGVPEEIVKGGTESFYLSTLILKTKRRAWLKRTIDGIDEKFGVHSLLEVFKGHLGGAKATTPFYIVPQGILDGEDALKEYKDLIRDINGPELNKFSLEDLRHAYISSPKKQKTEEEKLKKSKNKKKIVNTEEESSDESED